MIQRLGLLLFILLFRFYQLGLRPPHHDEAVNGWFVDGIFEKGFYHYDPQNYHGPIFFYILTFFEFLFGRSIEVLRTPTVLFGMALAFTPLLFKRWITERGAWIAAFFLAVSPAAVFYSRYTIHETGFALGCALFLYFWLRARTEGLNRNLIIGLGASLGFMAGMKENFVMYVGSLLLAEGIIAIMPKVLPFVSANDAPFRMNQLLVTDTLSNAKKVKVHFKKDQKFLQKVALVVMIAVVIIAVSFSALGRDGEGIANFFKAFIFWSETGSKGNGHQKPFYYWIMLLAQYEWLAFAGLIFTVLALKKVKTEIRIMSALGFGLWLAYSIVAYKTPWCLLSFYFILVMLSGFWISKWSEEIRGAKWVLSISLLIGFGVSAYQSYTVAYDEVDSDHHPYIYGQTFRSIMPPLNQILDRVKQNPELKKNLRIQVISKFTWPLPWVLGEVKQTAYYTEKNLPPKLDADYLIMDDEFEAMMAPRIQGEYTHETYPARQWARPMTIFTRKSP